MVCPTSYCSRGTQKLESESFQLQSKQNRDLTLRYRPFVLHTILSVFFHLNMFHFDINLVLNGSNINLRLAFPYHLYVWH